MRYTAAERCTGVHFASTEGDSINNYWPVWAETSTWWNLAHLFSGVMVGTCCACGAHFCLPLPSLGFVAPGVCIIPCLASGKSHRQISERLGIHGKLPSMLFSWVLSYCWSIMCQWTHENGVLALSASTREM
jgi:hypothetical protein